MRLDDLLETPGFSDCRTSYLEIVISAAGAFFGKLAIFIDLRVLLDPESAVIVVLSMGTDAVLLCAASKAAFSQSWNVAGP